MVNWAPPWHHGHSQASAWIQYSNQDSFHVLHGTYLTISKFDPPLPTGKVKLCPSMHAVRSSSASTFAQYGHSHHPPSTTVATGRLSKASKAFSIPASDMQFRRIKGASPSLYDDPAFSSDPCSHPFFKPSDESSLVSARYDRQVEAASRPRSSATPLAFTDQDTSPLPQGAQLIAPTTKPNSAKHVTSAPQADALIQRKRTKLSQLFWRKASSADAKASQSTLTDRRRIYEAVSRPDLPDPPRGSALIFKYTKRSLSGRRRAAAVAQPSSKLRVIADSPNHTCEVDRVDELDESNPLGLPIHHSGPYEAIRRLREKPKFQLQSNVTWKEGPEHSAKDHPREDAQEHVSSSPEVAAKDIHDGSPGISTAGAALPSFASDPAHKTPVSSDAGSSHKENRGRLEHGHSSSPGPSVAKDATSNVRNMPDDVLQPAPEGTVPFGLKLLTEVPTLDSIPPPVYYSPPRSISSLDQHPERFERSNDQGTLHDATDGKAPLNLIKEEKGPVAQVSPNSQPNRGSHQPDKAPAHPPTRYSNRQRSNVGTSNESNMPRHRFLPKRLVMPAPLQQSHLQPAYSMHAGGAEVLQTTKPLGPQPRSGNRQQVPRAQDIPIGEHQKLKKRTSSRGIFSVFSRKNAISPNDISSMKPEKPKTLKKRRKLFKF